MNKKIITALTILLGITQQVRAMNEEHIKRQMRQVIIFPLERTSKNASSMGDHKYQKFYDSILNKSRELCKKTLKFFPENSDIYINFVKQLHISLLLGKDRPLFKSKNRFSSKNPWSIENSTIDKTSDHLKWQSVLKDQREQTRSMEEWINIDTTKKNENRKNRFLLVAKKLPIYEKNQKKVTLPIEIKMKNYEEWEFWELEKLILD